ncbi:hypothetical protein EJB05_49240, partial [Eragrostis curvula]
MEEAAWEACPRCARDGGGVWADKDRRRKAKKEWEGLDGCHASDRTAEIRQPRGTLRFVYTEIIKLAHSSLRTVELGEKFSWAHRAVMGGSPSQPQDRGVTVASSAVSRWDLKPGDHIYTWCKDRSYLYAHHGIYESDMKVIHFLRDSDGSGSAVGSSSSSASTTTRPWCCAEAKGRGGVVVYCLDCFLDGGNLCLFAYDVPWWFCVGNVYQQTCSTDPEDPPERVLHRANYALAYGFDGYHLIINNCMHFACYCKTGIKNKVLVNKLLIL